MGAYAVARVALEVAYAGHLHLEGARDLLKDMSDGQKAEGVRTCESVRMASTS
jgi:hypothetical protein